MRLALAQTCFAPSSLEQALLCLDGLAGAAALEGADLLMLPECFLSGYGDAKMARALALDADAEAFPRLSALALRRGIAILCGYSERSGGDLYNSAALVSAAGDPLLNVRKMHLWGDFEGGVYRPGGRGEVAQLTPQLKVGVLICFDLEQAPAAEDLARRGAQMILAISATWAGYKVVPEAVVPTRAYENAVHVAFCNHVGTLQGARYAGRSVVAGPDGRVIARAPADVEALLYADVSAGPADRTASPALPGPAERSLSEVRTMTLRIDLQPATTDQSLT